MITYLPAGSARFHTSASRLTCEQMDCPNWPVGFLHAQIELVAQQTEQLFLFSSSADFSRISFAFHHITVRLTKWWRAAALQQPGAKPHAPILQKHLRFRTGLCLAESGNPIFNEPFTFTHPNFEGFW